MNHCTEKELKKMQRFIFNCTNDRNVYQYTPEETIINFYKTKEIYSSMEKETQWLFPEPPYVLI